MSIRTGRSSFRFLVAVAAGLLGAAVLSIGMTIWWLRSEAIIHASRDANNLAIVLAEQTANSIQSIDLVLTDIKEQDEIHSAQAQDDFDRALGGEDTNKFLLERLSRLQQAQFIALVDKNGRLVNTTQKWPSPKYDLAGRDYFQYLKNNDDKGIFISKTEVDRTKGTQVVFFAKRITGADNAFLGVAVAGVRLTYFKHIYDSISSLRDQSFLLLHRDGTIIVRYPDQNSHVGEKIPAASPWHRLVSQGGGHYRAQGYFHNEARLIAVRPLRDYPLVVDIAASETAALASWRNHAIFTGVGTLLALICSIFLLKMLSDRIRRLIESEEASVSTARELERANAKVDAALNNMSQGLVMFDSSARLVVCNQRYLDMFGLSREIIKPGASLRDVLYHRVATRGFAADEVEAYMADLLAAVAQGKTFSKITKLPDGRIIFIANQPTADGGWVATHEDITERLRTEERIQRLAHYDTLTELPNRLSFYERMEAVLSHLRRSETVSVLSLDLDHFKNVNDTLGHPIGDRLLRAAAERMRGCVRAEDIVARLGGDEFAIVQVPTGQPPNVTALAARLIEVVGAPYDIDGQQVVVGVSIGIAIAPSDSDVPDVLMKNADLALYRAKADGGGAYRFFEAEMDARMQARRALELDLRKAIVNGEFELYYQPIVDVKSGHVTSCEALVRWHHPERGMIAPLEFIPVAEETGLIVPLGEWILRQACAEAARWPKSVTISVNLSPAQFKSRNLVPMVINVLATSGLAASRLELEITELVLLQETEGAFAILHQLRDLGIRIAMDDFGTGYSSLGYLRSFPFDKIKIDQSFIHDLSTKEDSVAIIRAVVGLSSSLGITTTAEGVETKEQLARLTAEGCNEVQGFLFSPPCPAADIERMLAELGPRIEAVA